MLALDRERRLLFDRATGRRFDAARRAWVGARAEGGGASVDVVGAATWLQRESGHALRQPVGVIGPSAAAPEQLAAADALGRGLAAIGFHVVCGGRQGVMEAVCRGVQAKGGISIGLLPGPEATAANAYVTVPIATGIGEARNALIARAAFCLVAVGDSHGTLSEVALGLRFGRPVIGLAGAARIEGVHHCAGVDEAIAAVARHALGLAP